MISTTAMNSVDEGVILLAVVIALSYYCATRFNLQPDGRNPNQGAEAVQDWMKRPQQLYRATGLQPRTFRELCTWIRANTALNDTRYITLEEKVAIFLHICRQGAGFANSKIVFNRSLDTISRSVLLLFDIYSNCHRAFNQILNALVLLHSQIVIQPTAETPLPQEIKDNTKWMPYFKDCVGAIDGTHIPVHVPTVDKAAWRDRKGFITQNVFAACSFDLRFTFIHAGWQGSAHDALVLKDAIAKGRFTPPAGKYFVADGGFYSTGFMLIPYTKTRYHLREWEAAAARPSNKEELFNLRHAQLRNVIERIFGVLKRKFKILQRPPEFTIRQQVQLVLALTAVHNFIVDKGPGKDSDFEDLDEFNLEEWTPPPPPSAEERFAPARQAMQRLRDEIASQMWADYLSILQDRGQL